MEVIKLTTLADIQMMLSNQRHAYGVYARSASITQDWPVFKDGARINAEGRIECNFGEWNASKRLYLNEEWHAVDLVYAKHQCADCHYPPDMCCLIGVALPRNLPADSDPAAYYDTQALDEAEEALHYCPPLNAAETINLPPRTP